MDNFNVYNDIKARTGGEIYIGVVGPVRTGKSTFIKRFMDLLVLPGMEDEYARERTRDELPQSAAGKTIMTTEPKFIPKEAALVKVSEDIDANVRLIDCVGYMVEGATGHIENDVERMVKTPWFDYEIPFTQAAEIGTKKVIKDHSTIGFVITADGSFTEIPRENYIPAEERTVKELRKIGKPFIILLNSEKPYSIEAVQLARAMEEKYGVSVVAVNCQQLKREDINKVMEKVLKEFPVTEIDFFMPKWAEILPTKHPIKEDLVQGMKQIVKKISFIKEV
ncbi:MAG: stage IV sporulation protein A, partial [Clostridiales bacterium]|nr:stage IV sporulation protein A [Clostridiales bacterium]